MRPQAKALGIGLLGAFLWFLPWLAPGKALLGVHPACFRPFDQAVAPELLAEAKAASHPLYSEKLLVFDPEVRFSVQGIRTDGTPPAWNPEELGGLPHLATGLPSALYPLMWIAAVIPPPYCYAVIALLQTALCAFFTWLMLRAFDVSAPAAACGALLFAASGWMSVHQEYFQLTAAATWLPLALFGARRVLADDAGGAGAAGPLALGIAVACAFLSGFPQIAVFVLLAPGLLFLGTALLRLRKSAGSRAIVRPGIELALAVLLGLAIASPQLLATAELVPHSTRQPLTTAVIEAQALPPVALAGVLLPDVVAPARSQAASERRGLRESLFELALNADGGRNNRFEISFTLGPAALLFALLGMGSARRGARWYFLALLLAGLALTLPGPLLRASTRVPGLDIGDPKRALLLVELALVGLAALGLEPALAEAKARWRALLVLAAGALLLAGGAWWCHTSDGGWLRDWSAPRLARALALDEAVVAGLVTAERLDHSRGILTLDLLRAEGFLALALAALAWRHVQPLRLAPIGGMVAALAAPLWLFWRDTTSPIPIEGLDAKPPLVRHFELHPPAGRILRVGPRGELPPWPPMLPMNLGLAGSVRVRDAQGYTAAYLGAWRDLFEAADPGCTETVGVRPLAVEALTSPLLDLLDVEYAIAALPVDAPAVVPEGWQAEPLEGAASGNEAPDARGPIVVWRNPDAVGRAFVVTKVELHDDSRELVHALASPAFQPREQALLLSSVATPLRRDRRWIESPIENGKPPSLFWRGSDSSPPSEPSAATTTAPRHVEVVFDSSDAISFKVSGGGGLLVQTDCWYPGWSVRIDGGNAELLQVDHALRGVVVPAGEHRVEFRYLSRPLLLGLLLAPAALAALVFLSVRRGRA